MQSKIQRRGWQLEEEGEYISLFSILEFALYFGIALFNADALQRFNGFTVSLEILKREEEEEYISLLSILELLSILWVQRFFHGFTGNSP